MSLQRSAYQENIYLAAQHYAHDKLMDRDHYAFILSVFAKCVPAFLACFLVAFLRPIETLSSAPIATATVAFINCWPIILLWPDVVQQDWKNQRPIFLMMYIFYMVAYLFFGRVGLQTFLIIRENLSDSKIAESIEWKNVVANAIGGVIAASVISLISWYVSASASNS